MEKKKKYFCPICDSDKIEPSLRSDEPDDGREKKFLKCVKCGWYGPNYDLKLQDKKYEFMEARVASAWSKNERDDGGFAIDWAAKKCGFGGIEFTIENGKLYIDSEYMGRDFIKQCLGVIVDDAILRGSIEDRRKPKPVNKKELKKVIGKIKNCAKKGRISFREIKLRDKYKNSINEKKVVN
jgi:hypothetical protein